MKPYLSVLILTLLTIHSALASEDDLRFKPPGSDLRVFLAKGAAGDYSLFVFTPDGAKAFTQVLAPQVSPIIWNEKGTMGAFSAGTHFLMDAYVLFLQSPNHKLIKLPSPRHGWDNYHSTPLTWSGDTLLVDIDGPHAGKAGDYHYSGKMKISLKTSETAPEIIEEKITVDSEHDKD